MLHDPLHLFDSNAFYPHPLSLAFSDSLLGYGPAGFFGSGTVAALVRYNLLFLFAWSLCFVGALPARARARPGQARRRRRGGRLRLRALPRDRGRPPARDLLRRHRRWRCSCCCAATGAARAGWCIAGWLVSAWQISLGFTLGLQFSYLLAVLALLAAVLLAGARRAARRCRARWSLITCVGHRSSCGACRVYQARPYLKVAARLPDRQAHDQGSQELLLRSRRAALGLLGEPRVGRRHRRRARARALQERGRVLPRRLDPRCSR